jgi:general secretion pathway protein I
VQRFRQNEKGLTLVEVLIALVILSIALTAVIKSASQNIQNTFYLQNRTIATWIGTNVINSIRAGIIKVPSMPDKLSQNDSTLGQNWTWNAVMNATPNPRIKQIIVEVYHQPDDKRFAHLESYVYAN